MFIYVTENCEFAVTNLKERASHEGIIQTLPVNHASHKQVAVYTFPYVGWVAARRQGGGGWGAGLSPVL